MKNMNSVIEDDCQEILTRIKEYIPEIAGRSFLVAGVTSFLGSSIVNTLAYYNLHFAKKSETKCHIYGLYRNKDKLNKRFGHLLSEDFINMFAWDATLSSDQIDIDDEVDYVFYLCSNATTDLSIRCPVETIQSNTIGLTNILEFARKKKVKGFLYFSSGAVYGTVGDKDCEIDEDDRWIVDHTSIDNVYSVSKRVGEALCVAYAREYGVNTRIVRISHTYGPGIDIDDGRVFSDFVKNIINGEDLVIKGDGSAVRPFCYISDAICAFFIVIFRGKNGKAYNMANPDETYSISELAMKLVKKGFPERNLSVNQKYMEGIGVQSKSRISIKLLESLGWKPQIDVIVGFRRTVSYYENMTDYNF